MRSRRMSRRWLEKRPLGSAASLDPIVGGRGIARQLVPLPRVAIRAIQIVGP
jgi:hypothetical protein